jgi:hypothetical protein
MPEEPVVVQDPQPVAVIPVSPPVAKKPFRFLLYFFILFFGTVLGFIIHDRITGGTNPEKEIISEKPSVTPKPSDTSDLALIPYIPNFDSLTVEDLPNMTDTRGIYPYNSRYIVASVGKVIEYDDKSEMIVRVNNPSVLPCIFSTALIGDNLYVTCNDVNVDANGKWIGKATLSRINLTSGKITKRYFESDTKTRINFWVTSLGTDLWGSSWDGVFKMDTITDTVTEYSSQSLGFPNYRPSNIYVKDNALRVHFAGGDNNPGSVEVYDANSDSWKQLPDSYEAVHAVNEAPSVGGKSFPYYVAVSPRFDDMYYVYARDAVYTLKRSGFPVKFKNLVGTIGSIIEPSVYVSADKQYSVIIGSVDGMGGDTLASQLPTYLIAMQTGVVYNLTGSYTNDLGPTNTITQTAEQGFTFTPQPQGVLIKEKENQNLFATVDFPSHTLTIPNVTP